MMKGKLKEIFNLMRCQINRYFLLDSLLEKSDQLHLGCSGLRLLDCINTDIRSTDATDIVCDSTDFSFFPKRFFSVVYSNAFFEHLYIPQREKCLGSIYKILKPGGVVVFIGMPDFKEVAYAYLQKKPGIKEKVFDLSEVYRYTHGDPEQVPDWWLEQLHKGLIDPTTLEKLLIKTHFLNYYIFNYCWKAEKLPLTIGFVAFKTKPKTEFSTKSLENYLKSFTDSVAENSLRITLKSRS